MRTSGCWIAACAAVLVAIGGAAGARDDEDPRVTAKRLRSPVDARLHGWAGAPGRQRARQADRWPLIVRPDGIVIDAASNGDPQALLAELRALGLRDAAVAGNLV